MPVTGKVLEDSIRLAKIRRIKLVLYLLQTAVLISLGAFVAFWMGGAAVTPDLYIPVPPFVAVVVLLLLIICLEGFFFRVLEIRFSKSSSARHLMAKNSIRKAILLAIISGICATILLVPSIVNGIENALERKEVITAVEEPLEPLHFYSMDPLAMTETRHVGVTATRQVEVYLVTEQNYLDNANDLGALYSVRINRNNYVVTSDEELRINVPGGGHERYRLILNDLPNPGTSAIVALEKTLSPIFTDLISMFLIAFIVANAAWAAYLIPIERKYSAGSIYK